MSKEREGWITKEKAKEMVIKTEDKMVHTFFNQPFGLIGGDHSYKSIMEDIDNSYECNETGESAKKMGHGLAILPSKECNQSDILFVETKHWSELGLEEKKC